MKYIIFGGDGFVGHHLVDDLLKKGKQVVVCDLVNHQTSERATYIQMDVRDKNTFEQIPMDEDDIVVNLAANQYHHKVPKKNRKEFFFDTNAVGVENILEYMRKKGCTHMVQYTTDMTYGKPQYLPVDTVHPQNPFGPYGQSKKKAEDICRKYRKKGIHITIFRPRMINGPGRLGILKKLFVLIKYNFPVPTIGNGQNCYQMISVYDCVSATEKAMEKGCPDSEYNLGSENAPSTHDLLKGLIKNVHSKSFVVPTPGKLVKTVLAILGKIGLEIMYKEQYMIADENYILDISKTKEELNWMPQYSDQDMIIQAYRDWMSKK